jgi:fatty acid desaturase
MSEEILYRRKKQSALASWGLEQKTSGLETGRFLKTSGEKRIYLGLLAPVSLVVLAPFLAFLAALWCLCFLVVFVVVVLVVWVVVLCPPLLA